LCAYILTWAWSFCIIYIVATITRRLIRGRPYYYAVQCQRVNGKPRLVYQKYLGTAEQIIAGMTQGLTRAPRTAEVLDFGDVYALYKMAQRLRVIETVDHILTKRDQGLSVGEAMLLCAINRAVQPKSKRQIGDWFNKTILRRLIPAKNHHLTSQRFWDAMSKLQEYHLVEIEKEFSRILMRDFQIDLQCLIYDTTNFFTYIDTFNQRNRIAVRGHNKQKRMDLRQINLALMVTRDFHIPLFHKIYEGNLVDRTAFRSIVAELVERYQILSQHCQAITLVYDKGNHSTQAQEVLDESPYHFVGSLVPSHHPDLLAIPLGRYRSLEEGKLQGVRIYRTEREVFGRKRTIVITYSDEFFLKQIQTILLQLKKRTQTLKHLKVKLAKSKRVTIESAQTQVEKILSFQHMKQLIKVRLTPEGRSIKLFYHTDRKAFRRLQRTLLGKTILFTDQDQWTDEEIILAYRGQYKIEDAFKQMKDPHFVSWHPMFHWTDQKIRVHAFYCVLALMLVSLLQRELARKNISISVDAMLESLSGIKAILLLYPDRDSKRIRVQGKTILSQMNPTQARLFKALQLGDFGLN